MPQSTPTSPQAQGEATDGNGISSSPTPNPGGEIFIETPTAPGEIDLGPGSGEISPTPSSTSPSTPFDPGDGDEIGIPAPRLPYSGVGTLAVERQTLHLPLSHGYLGQSLALLPDFDGDGRVDLAVGAPSLPNTLLSNGYIYLLSDYTQSGDISALASEIYVGTSGGAQAGHSLVSGDFDQDGLSDLVIGAPDRGEAHLIFGHDKNEGQQKYSLNDTGITFSQPGGYFSHTLAAGDVNASGFDDLAFGDPMAGNDFAGAISVYFGQKRSAYAHRYAEKDADVQIWGNQAHDYVGSALSVGDLTGSGAASIAVGAMGYESDAAESAGAVAVFFPRITWPKLLNFDDADLILVGESPGGLGSGAGNAVLAGCDINGDGIGDLIVGASGYGNKAQENTGRLYLFRGGSGYKGTLRLSVADGMYTGQLPGDQAGFHLSCAGDINGDGFDEVLVSAIGHSERRGQTYLLYGQARGWPSQGLLSEAEASWVGSHGGDESGKQSIYLPAQGQTPGHLVIASPFNDEHGENGGLLYLIPHD